MQKVTTDRRPIVETGAVIARLPFDGKWVPFVRREGESFGTKQSPEFNSASDAAECARELKVAHQEATRRKGKKS